MTAARGWKDLTIAVPLPWWWRTNLYYGWALVGTLGVTAMVSYGILAYGFSVFIAPMSAELGWSRMQITGAYSLAQLTAGVAAIPAGHWVDRFGARALMTTGSAIAVLLVVAWSRVETLTAFYLTFLGLGITLAAILYEPAFAVVATWFRRDRAKALTILTFIGGFASVIFVPLAAQLVSRFGWRAALQALAAVLAVLTVLPHAVVLRRRPEAMGLAPDGGDSARGATTGWKTSESPVSEASVSMRDVVRGRTFRWITVAFALSGFTTTAVSVHLVSLLLERGYNLRFAAAAMGVMGLMALPGRLVFTPLGGRRSRSLITASIFGLQATALVVLLATRSAASVWAFAVLFGAGLGAITPARAALLADLFGAEQFGRINGLVAMFVSLARGAAPVGASILYAAARPGHGYHGVTLVLLGLCIASGVAVLIAGDAREPLADSGCFNRESRMRA